MTFLCKKTNELTAQELEGMSALFLEVFEKDRDADTFYKEYCSTPLGYSYHCIALSDIDEVVGFHSWVPFYYTTKGERFIAVFGADSMVRKSHRDFYVYQMLMTSCNDIMKADGCKLYIGIPNDNSHPLVIKGLRHKDVGKLTTYCLVRNISGVIPTLKYFNFGSRIFSFCQHLLSYLSICKRQYQFTYGKEHESFDNHRYSWFGGNYRMDKIDDFQCVYKIQKQENAEVAFLMDVYPLSRSNFEKSVRHIYKKHRKDIDMIMYVGNLPFTPIGLITIPHRFEPKHFYFTCKGFDKAFFDKSIFDISQWDINLSNFDLL